MKLTIRPYRPADLPEMTAIWNEVAVVFLAAGLVIGVGGSLSAIRRFLQV